MINYKYKYLKYRSKYNLLKNYLGGIVKHDNSILIPEYIVEYDDLISYHQHPMYKKLVRYHLCITSRLIENYNDKENDFKKRLNDDNLIGSFIKLDRIDKSYKSCDNETPIFEDKYDVGHNFQFIGSLPSYFLLSKRKFYILKKNKSLFIWFDVGTQAGYDLFDHLIINDFFNFLNIHKNILIESKQIILLGHSAGMTMAVLTAFLFLCLGDKNYLFENAEIFKDNPNYPNQNGKGIILFNKLTSESDYNFLKEKSIFVVGTASRPILFNEKQFINFYNKLKGRYVNIIIGLDTNYKKEKDFNKYYLDLYTEPIDWLTDIDPNKCIGNFKFGLYLSKITIIKLSQTVLANCKNAKLFPKQYYDKHCTMKHTMIIQANNQNKINYLLNNSYLDIDPSNKKIQQIFKTINYEIYKYTEKYIIPKNKQKLDEICPKSIDDIGYNKYININTEFSNLLVGWIHQFTNYRNYLTVYFFDR
jgi:hypothetical protein